jgi:hypothetical protein
MIQFQSNQYDKVRDKSKKIASEYFGQSLALYFGVFTFIIFFLMAKRESLLYPGLIGLGFTVILAQISSKLKMKRDVIEVNFSGQFYCIVTVFDFINNIPIDYQPVAHCNLNYLKDKTQISFGSTFYKLSNNEFPQLNTLIQTIKEGGEYIPPTIEPLKNALEDLW